MEETISILKAESSSDPSISVVDAKLWNPREDVFNQSNEEIIIRKDKIQEGGEIKFIRRVFVNKPQTSAYSNVGWVVDRDVEVCMLCATNFTFFNRRHHCAVCGGIMCGDCSTGQLLISEFPEFDAVRACDQCFCGQEEVSVQPHFMILEGNEEEEEEEEDDDMVLEHSEVMTDLISSPSPDEEDNTPNEREEDSKDIKPRSIGTYLMKKSPALLKGWQKRYVVLKDGHLKYYLNREAYDDDLAPKGSLAILQIPSQNIEESIIVSGADRNEIHIRITGDPGAYKRSKASKDRLLVLQAIDEDTAVAWTNILHDWVVYLNKPL